MSINDVERILISKVNLFSFKCRSMLTVMGSDLLTLVPTTSHVVFLDKLVNLIALIALNRVFTLQTHDFEFFQVQIGER